MKKNRITVILPPLRDSADRIMCSTADTIPLASFKLNKRNTEVQTDFTCLWKSSYYIITKACD